MTNSQEQKNHKFKPFPMNQKLIFMNKLYVTKYELQNKFLDIY